ncbi:hypothetical protein JCM11641_003191 [Rhodosporidiobolus odoratus]
MGNSAIFLAAIIVPPACVLALILYSIYYYFHFLRPARRSPTCIRNSVSYPVAHLPPMSSIAQRAISSSPFPLSPTVIPSYDLPPRRAPLPPFEAPHSQPPIPPTPAPAPPPATSPAESRFLIATTMSRKGSRVLTRNPSSNNSHGTRSTGGTSSGRSGVDEETGRKSERRRSKPEKTKRVKRQFGIGDGDEERDYDDTVIIDVVAGARPPGMRRRNSTWSAVDLEQVMGQPARHSRTRPNSPPGMSAVSAPATLRRPGAKPLLAKGETQRTGVEHTPSNESVETAFPDSEESGDMLLRRAEEAEVENLEPSREWTEGRKVVVRDLRGEPTNPIRPAASAIDRRHSARTVSSYDAHSADEFTLTAASSTHAFFSTAIVPLAPSTPSPDRDVPPTLGDTGRRASDPELVGAGLTQRPQFFQHYPTRSHPSHSTPPALPARYTSCSAPEHRVSNASTATMVTASKDIEHYAASFSSDQPSP